MIEYVHSAGIPNDIIRKMINCLHKQDYDTDAIKLDVNIDSVQSQQSSVLFHMKHEPLIESISKFVDKTKGTHSLNGCVHSLNHLPLFGFDVVLL